MKQQLVIVGCVALLSGALVYGQAAGTAQPPSPPAPATAARAAAALPTTVASASDEAALVNRYCVTCHNEKMKGGTGPNADAARKLTIDTLDPAHVENNREEWERIVRKLRAGMMPPAGTRRPEPVTYKSMISWLESELDRTATPYMPPPGLHRLNRTEYANVIRDLLDLEIDPGKYLPSDDSTRGFDNIAGALGISSTLVEAYVSAAGKISRLAIGEAATPNLVVYRTPEDTSQDYHIEGLPFGTRGGMLVSHVFPSDGEYTVTVTPIFGDNMSPTGFGSVPCEKLEILLDGQLVEVLDWQGGGRFGVAPATCGAAGRGGQRGRGAAAPAAGQAPAADNSLRQPGAPPAAAAAGQRGGRGAGPGAQGTQAAARQPPVAVVAGAAVPRCASASRRRPDRTRSASRSCKPTSRRSSTWISISSGTRCRPVRRPGSRSFRTSARCGSRDRTTPAPAKDSPSRRRIFVCRPTSAADETACARKVITRLATRAFRRPAAAVGRQRADEVLRDRPHRRRLRSGHRAGAGPHSGVAEIHLPDRGGAGAPRRPVRRIASATSTSRRGCPSSSGAPSPTMS